MQIIKIISSTITPISSNLQYFSTSWSFQKTRDLTIWFVKQSNIIKKVMKQNPQQTPKIETPQLFSLRPRINSINSPFISPLRIVQSPIMSNQQNFFDFQLRSDNFQLQPQQNDHEQVHQQQPIEQSESENQKSENQDLQNIEVDENNILDVILKNVNIRDPELNLIAEKLSREGDGFKIQMFDYLLKKFKKLRKTKQEMIKYSIRKAFRYITDALKKEMPNYAVDSNQYLQYYFDMHAKVQNITVPFKKDSLEKTMNSVFLKKIFTCQRFVSDYKAFLRLFKKEYQKDNQKKVDGMKEIVRQCFKAKCFKGLDNFKRLPWTLEILNRLQQFSKQLLQFAPKNSKREQNSQQNDYKIEVHENEDKQQYGSNLMEQNHHHQSEKWNNSRESNHLRKQSSCDHLKDQSIRFKTKSIILLTPPMKPMQEPKIPDLL